MVQSALSRNSRKKKQNLHNDKVVVHVETTKVPVLRTIK